MTIAIDGPSGAGKSTLAKALAREFSLLYIDTGALYRAVGLYARRMGVDPQDAAGVDALLPEIRVTLEHENGTQYVYLNGEDVSTDIRQPEISHYASCVSAIPAVRTFLLAIQREIADSRDVIMDGRDIGTVVFPDAEIKIYLHATVEERAHRRYEELIRRGTPQDCETVLADMRARDARDSTRSTAPLCRAPDAIELETTGNTFEKSLAELTEIIRERL